MSFATEVVKSVSDFRVLVNIDSRDATYAGRFSAVPVNPSGSTYQYDARLASIPKISINRDSSQFGILVFSSSAIELDNTDGHFDSLVDTYNIIGATVTIRIGYEGLAYSEYVVVFTGYAERLGLSENRLTISIADIRKRLEISNTTDTYNVDSVQAIENILVAEYGITAGSTYFDVSAMTAAKSLAYKVVRRAPDGDTVDRAITDLVKCSLGFMFITGDGRYSYKMIDTSATSVSVVSRHDIIDFTPVAYATDEVAASVYIDMPKWSPIQLPAAALNMWGGGHATVLSNGYILSSTWISTTQSYIYRSTDDASSFSAMLSTSQSFVYYEASRFGEISVPGYVVYNSWDGATATDSYWYRSNDYGSSWTVATSIAAIRSWAYLGSGVCVAGSLIGGSIFTATSSTMYKSTDFGDSWATVQTIAGYQITSIDAVSGNNAYALAVNATTRSAGTVYRTVDRGSSWTVCTAAALTRSYTASLATAREFWAGIGTPDGDRVYVYFQNSAYPLTKPVLVSYDGASTFSSIAGTENMQGVIDELSMDSNKDAYLWGFFGSSETQIWKTTPVSEVGPSRQSSEMVALSGYVSTSSTIYAHWFDTHNDRLFSVSQPFLGGSISYYESKPSNTYFEDTTYQASVLSAYGISTVMKSRSLCKFQADSESLASDLIAYFKDAHGKFSITVPMAYYAVNVGDNIDVQVWRNNSVSMLGTKKCEVLGKAYNFDNAMITFGLRIISDA